MSSPASKDLDPLWKSPIQPGELARQVQLLDLAWDSDGTALVWHERRSDRGILVCQAQTGRAPRDLPCRVPIGARVGYGGGDFTAGHGQVFFSAQGRLFRQSLKRGPARPITPVWGDSASPSLSADGKFLLFVHSAEDADCLALVDSKGRHWPVRLAQGNDFYMQPCWHPGGRLIAWIAWNHPNMPWHGTALYLGQLVPGERLPVLSGQSVAAGDPEGRVALFQPAFSPDGRFLSFVSDETGWSNLQLLDLRTGRRRVLVRERAEHALPAWQQGLRTHCWSPDSRSIYFLRLKQGSMELMRLSLAQGRARRLGGAARHSTAFAQIACSPTRDRIAVIASAPARVPRILSFSSGGKGTLHRQSQAPRTRNTCLSQPRPESWRVKSGKEVIRCHGLFYAPRNPRYRPSGRPPAVIKVHGGPTSQYLAEYRSETQFLTSRGFAVLELNYRGSSGYGRAYREALRGNWGVTDVEDVGAAAEFLISRKRVHPARLFLMGGSAGGYTVLMALAAWPGRFRAGICRYPVSNLLTLSSDTHKFESRYLEWLAGPPGRGQSRYRRRSPVFQADRIQDPVALFQGEEDRVVPKSQSEEVVESLKRRGIPCLYRLYSGEGHGWRKAETIHDYCSSLESFLREQLFRSL